MLEIIKPKIWGNSICRETNESGLEPPWPSEPLGGHVNCRFLDLALGVWYSGSGEVNFVGGGSREDYMLTLASII